MTIALVGLGRAAGARGGERRPALSPGLAVEELGRLAAQVRESIAELALEGKLGSLSARDDRAARRVLPPGPRSGVEGTRPGGYARAGVRCDRISNTLEDGATAVASSPRGTEVKEDG
jgi:hypothetical protein